ncbi:LTA synthase family protein [Paenibacillus cymbidii]|uniref:LTA synthase family protein n=1 Tax=Paenibacillus cymbidii TaxID=1639034 RepID=UPI001F2DF7BD|nr:LTA synthase family protein [Paenibacillus cymbidii]
MRILNRRFFFFTVILLLKGYLAWNVVFDNVSLGMTLLTEIPCIWGVFCLIEWWASKRKLLYYVIVNLLFTLLYFTVLMYYKYYGIIVTYHALHQADKVTQVGNSTYSLLDPYYLLIFLDIVVLAALLWWPKKRKELQTIGIRPMNRRLITGLFVVSLVVSLFNIWPNRANMNENKQASEMGILNYELYTLLSDPMEKEELVDKANITQSAIDKLKGVSEQGEEAGQWAAAEGKNVIIIQMESFQNFLIGLTVDGKEITPNMNRLAQDDFHFDRFFTMVGQGTTSDAEYVVNTSMYVPKHAAATDHYVDKALPSLPKLMHANGYLAATFHTNKVEFWNRIELYPALGWDRYYDERFFGDDDHVAFGSSDEVLYAKTLDELQRLDEQEQPFYAQIISMSAHHPYDIPKSKYKMTLPDRFENTLVGDYIRAQNYADYALGAFIDGLKSSGLWEDSVVLLYGDHQGLPLYSLSKDEKTLMQEMVGHEYGYTDMFNIPLIMHVPDVTYPAVIHTTGGQIDILPTVANLTGVKLDDQLHFGQDLLNAESNLLPMRHFLPTGSVVTDTDIFLTGKGYEDGTNYSLSGGTVDQARTTEEQYNRALELLHLSDSYVEQLPDRPQTASPGPSATGAAAPK